MLNLRTMWYLGAGCAGCPSLALQVSKKWIPSSATASAQTWRWCQLYPSVVVDCVLDWHTLETLKTWWEVDGYLGYHHMILSNRHVLTVHNCSQGHIVVVLIWVFNLLLFAIRAYINRYSVHLLWWHLLHLNLQKRSCSADLMYNLLSCPCHTNLHCRVFAVANHWGVP